MRRWALIITAAAAILGAAVATVSTIQHLRIERTGLEEASFCAISERINCDIVNASSYSEIFRIPVSSFGVAFYLLFAAISIAGIFTSRAKPSVAAAWFLSDAGVVVSIYLAYVSIHVLGVICIECLALYAVNVLLFIFFFIALKIPFGGMMRFIRDYFNALLHKPSNLGFKPRAVMHASIIAVGIIAAFLTMKGIDAKDKGDADRASVDEKIRAFYMQSLSSIEPDPNWAVWGNADAKVTIMEFSDFQCPFCKVMAFNLKPRLQEFRKDIRFYFVNYPLDQACNEALEHPMHQWACMAAKASICANKKGNFWEFHDALFKKQKSLSDETILSIGEKHGWNREDLQTCIDSPEVDAQVKKDIAAGKKIYVSGTPTVFIGDRKLKYWRDSDFLQELVKEEIKRSRKQ